MIAQVIWAFVSGCLWCWWAEKRYQRGKKHGRELGRIEGRIAAWQEMREYYDRLCKMSPVELQREKEKLLQPPTWN